MKRKQNQITITAIIICLACAVSGLAASPEIPLGFCIDPMPSSEVIGCKQATLTQREIGSNMSLRPPTRVVDLACSCGKCQRLLLIRGRSTSLKSGDPKHTAKTAIVSYINNQNPVNLHDVAKDLSFLMRIDISIDKKKVDEFTNTMKEALGSRGFKQEAKEVSSWEIQSNYTGMNLGKEGTFRDNTGLAVLEHLARKFNMTIQWTESGVVLAPDPSNSDTYKLVIE